jgi:glycosyltransferase involved in cell wall biosynthesis
MKLLFVVPDYGPSDRGGIGTYYRNLFPALLRTGCKIDVCIVWGGEAKPDQIGVNNFFVDRALVKREAERLAHLAATPILQHILARNFAAWETCNRGSGYDVVEVADWNMMYAPWLAASNGPKVVVQLHGSSGQIDFYDAYERNELAGLTNRLLDTALFGRADELQAYSPKNAEFWSNLLNRPVHHIWPAWGKNSDVNKISPPRQSDRYGIVAGRIQSWKGPDVLCKAAALLGPSAPEIRWVGKDFPYRRFGQSFSAYLKKTYPTVWGKSIKPIGELSPEGTAALQAAARFAVVPSIWDTFNLTTIEAMGIGKVVICSDGAGAAALIDHGVNGFRFPAGDAASLAELIAKVGAMPAPEREAIGRLASETIKQELDADRIAALRLDRFARLQACPPARSGPHPWLENFFASSEKPRPFGFLEGLPLREIVRHAAKRIMRRIRSGKR